MFNSFGNLCVDPTAALLFVDFRRGTTLQLSGTAAVRWDVPAAAGDDARTGRRVEFAPQQVIATRRPCWAKPTTPGCRSPSHPSPDTRPVPYWAAKPNVERAGTITTRRVAPDLHLSVELPGIEPAAKIDVTCNNAEFEYAKVREST